MYLNPGDIISGRFRILAQLGRGGFGKTYKAKDIGKPGNPLCVVKEIIPPQAQEPQVFKEAEKRFVREAKILSRLGEHPQIPKLFDYFQNDEKFYLIQEYIEGHDLSQEIAPGKQLSEKAVVELLLDVLEVLKFVHEQNIIHRDIKPSNLMRRTQDGKIILIDFGAVKELNSLTITTPGDLSITQAIGTPGYMAVEQQSGNPQLNSDLYALGMICLQSLTGLHPRTLPSDPKTGDIIWRYSTAERPMIDVSLALEKVLNKMVRYHFSERYNGAAEALEDLRNSVLTPSAAIYPKIKRRSKVGQRQKKWWLGLGLVAVVLGVWSLGKLISTTCPLKEGDDLSCGEEILIKAMPIAEKKEGVTAYAEGNYQEAVVWLTKARIKQPSDPETLIYLNNAQLATNHSPFYTIAVAVPLGNPADGGDSGKEILRGVAQVQDKINQGQKINGLGLRVLIADDYNNPDRAYQIAQKLVKQPEILVVVGHYTSDSTRAALPVYNPNKLVLISPTSTAELLAQDNSAFFRTVPQDSVMAEALAAYLYKKAQQQKVAIFYNPNSAYSRSLHERFLLSFEEQEGQVVRRFDLSQPIFNANATLKQVQKRGGTGLVLFPDAKVNPYAFSNALKVIRANQNHFLIAGGDSLYTTDILQEGMSLKNLIVAIPWNHLSNANQNFTKEVKQLWGGNVSWRTAMAYDATLVLTVALENQRSLGYLESLQALVDPSIRRVLLLQSLKQPNFQATGATGKISFELNGDRHEPVVELVKVAPSRCSPYGYLFIPIKYPTAEAAEIKCKQ